MSILTLILLLLSLITSARADAGAPPLRVSEMLNTAAQAHAQDMGVRNYVSHVTPDGVRLGQRLDMAGYGEGRLYSGENLTAGRDNAEATFADFMNSQGHRHNILDAAFIEIGIGLFVDEQDEHNVVLWSGDIGGPYYYYWVIVFGQRRTAQAFVPLVE